MSKIHEGASNGKLSFFLRGAGLLVAMQDKRY